ncbi:MAG: serine hydrolase domain-containing protein [Pyrinomonadaceae bacterium]
MKKILQISPLLICPIALLLSPILSRAQSKQSSKAVSVGASKYLKRIADQSEFSGSVLIARNGRILFSRGFGLANRENDIPNTSKTKFLIGSLTKQFTAMAVMMLAERGKLKLEESICKYVSACPAVWQPISIRQLLNHSSGIVDLVRLPEFGETITLPTTLDRTIERLKKEPLQFVPGEKAEYGNSGFLLAAFIVEKVSGKSYEDFLRENIYEPLSMKDSGYAHNESILKNRARGYARNHKKIVNASYIDMSIPIGAGSQYSTVEDLFRWDQALYTEKLVSKQGLDEMFRSYKGEFGLGWEIGRQFNRKIISHIGDINGFGAYIARYPDDKVLIVVLSNLEGTPVKQITNDLAAMIFG